MCTSEFYFAPRRLSASARQGDAHFPERSSGTRLIGTLLAERPKACLRKIVARACNICRPRVLHGLARQDWRPIAAHVGGIEGGRVHCVSSSSSSSSSSEVPSSSSGSIFPPPEPGL